MVYINDRVLSTATKILRSRLNNYRSLGANILEPNDVERSKLDDNFGSYIGYFIKRSNMELSFVLFIRDTVNPNDIKLFVFYLHKTYKQLQIWEIGKLKLFAPNYDLSKYRLINISSPADRIYDISLFISALEAYVGPELLDKPQGVTNISIDAEITYLSSTGISGLPFCNQIMEPKDVIQQLRHFGFTVAYLTNSSSRPVSYYEVLVVLLDYHVYYFVAIGQNKLSLLITHHSHFQSEDDYAKLANLVTRRCGNVEIIPSRVHSGTDLCTSDYIVKIILMSFNLRPNATYFARPIDASSIENLEAFHMQFRKLPIERDPETWPPPSSADSVETDININYDDFGSINIDPPPRNVWTVEESISLFTRNIDMTIAKFPDNIIPIVIPLDDPDLTIFKEMSFINSLIERITLLWSTKRKTTYLLCAIALEDLASFEVDGERFFIQLLKHNNNVFCIVIDVLNEDWIMMDPSNYFHGKGDEFERVISRITTICNLHGQFTGRSIAMTSSFHRNYPFMHLAMGLYSIFKYIHFDVALPNKLIYTEKDLRCLITSIQIELNRVNLIYNSNSKLIDRYGVLLPNAYRSNRFYILSEPGIVKEDQCPFCLKRNMKYLTNHIRLKHSGDATRMARQKHAIAIMNRT